MNKKNTIFTIIMVFILVSTIAFAGLETRWNPWTNRLDYVRGDNLDANLNLTGNLTVHGGLLVQASPPTTKMANITLLNVKNGTYDAANQTLLSVSNETYQLNTSRVILDSPFHVYSANGSVPFRLLSSGNYSLNSTTADLTITSLRLIGHNLTVDYNEVYLYDFNASNVNNVKVYASLSNGSSNLTLLSDGNYSLVGTNGTFELTNFVWNGSNVTLDYTRTDYINVPPGHGYFEGNVTANWYTGGTNWTNLDLYPVACPSGYYVTQIADEVTCTAVNQTIGDFNVSGNIKGQNISVNGNLAISYNSTCHFFYSPAGTGVIDVCD